MRRERGFTAVELMIVVLIVAILAAIGAPNLRDMVYRNRLLSVSSDLSSDFALARSSAVQRGMRVGICASADLASCNGTSWGDGWIIYTDAANDGFTSGTDTILRVHEALPAGFTISPTPSAMVVQFRPSGPANVTRAFQVCYAGFTGRQIDIESTGRVASKQMGAACP